MQSHACSCEILFQGSFLLKILNNTFKENSMAECVVFICIKATEILKNILKLRYQAAFLKKLVNR